MRVNRDIIDTVVTQYVRALQNGHLRTAYNYLCKLGNWGIEIVVKDPIKGILTWRRKDEKTN